MRTAFILLTWLLASVPAAAQVPVSSAETQSISFNYQDAELRFVIAALAEMAGLNVVFSTLPSRTVTLRTNAPVARGEVRDILMSVLAANSLRVVEEGTLLRIEAPPQESSARGSESPDQDMRVFVHRLRHAQASRLASTIQSLFSGGAITPDWGRARGGLSQSAREFQVPPVRPEEPPTQTAAPPAVRGSLSGSFQIYADELTNSLLVRATPSDWDIIRQAVEALDLRPLQVVIEVLIAEVRRSSTLSVGVSVDVPNQRDPGTGVMIGGELVGASSGDLIVRLMEVGRVSADVVLTALSSRGDVTILSRPVVLALNNQEARILVGSERPFVQVFRALPTDNAVRDQVVQYREVGTSLTIRPTINHDGYVSLDLLQEVSTATNETQFGAPVISTRQTSTQLLARNKQTVVIGGLVDRQNDRTRGGVPILKDIPILGWLFGSTQRTAVHTELFLFVTPHIIANDEDADAIRESVRQEADLLRKELPLKINLFPDSTSR